MQFGTPDRAGLLSHPLNPGTMSRSGFLKSLAIGDHNQLDRHKLASSPDLAFRNPTVCGFFSSTLLFTIFSAGRRVNFVLQPSL
ncbi:hypothetical protein LB505_006638 [Fusarium chuoi]|nr:hypothetical protein LB505_006638 [Fusarium chuoi]